MSSSSSSATAPASRSPSPLTPDVSDSIEPLSVQSDAEHTSSWVIAAENSKAQQPWDESLFTLTQNKLDDGHVLRLDDLIEPHAYHEYVLCARQCMYSQIWHSTSSPGTTSSYINSPQPQASQTRLNVPYLEPIHSDSPSGSLPVPSSSSAITLTKPAPPPASLPRKPDLPSLNNRVVQLPKESCSKFVIKQLIFHA